MTSQTPAGPDTCTGRIQKYKTERVVQQDDEREDAGRTSGTERKRDRTTNTRYNEQRRPTTKERNLKGEAHAHRQDETKKHTRTVEEANTEAPKRLARNRKSHARNRRSRYHPTSNSTRTQP